MKKLFVIIISLCGMASLMGQPTLTIGNYEACEGSLVNIPIMVSGFNNVAAFTLYIPLDSTKAGFVNVVNPHATLGTGSLVFNYNVVGSPAIIVVWQSLIPASISSGKLFDLRLNYHQGITSLSFSPNCELANGNLEVIQSVTYSNGQLSPHFHIASQPQTIEVPEGTSGNFSVSATGTLPSYVWQSKVGGGWVNLTNGNLYSGVNTPELEISMVPSALNGLPFRCKVFDSQCTLYSDSALLHVNPVTWHYLPVGEVEGFRFQISGSSLEYFFSGSCLPCNCYIRVTELSGRILIRERISQQTGVVSIPASHGFYLVDFESVKEPGKGKKVYIH